MITLHLIHQTHPRSELCMGSIKGVVLRFTPRRRPRRPCGTNVAALWPARARRRRRPAPLALPRHPVAPPGRPRVLGQWRQRRRRRRRKRICAWTRRNMELRVCRPHTGRRLPAGVGPKHRLGRGGGPGGEGWRRKSGRRTGAGVGSCNLRGSSGCAAAAQGRRGVRCLRGPAECGQSESRMHPVSHAADLRDQLLLRALYQPSIQRLLFEPQL
jgi:hypothetical protein